MKAPSLLLVLAACSNSGGTATTIGQAQSSSAGQTLAAGVEQGAATFGPITTGSGADASCATLSGDTSDPDGDHIPNNATLTYNCSASAFGATGTLTGTLNVVDDQPASIAWAFTGMADLMSSLTDGRGTSVTATSSGKLVASQVSIAGPFALARNLDGTTELKTATKTTTVDETDQWTITYTPMFQWTPGTIVVTGALSVSGMWDVTVDGAAANATLSTPTPLTLTPACRTRVTAGTVVASYTANGQGNTITVTWTGCGQSTVTYANPEM